MAKPKNPVRMLLSTRIERENMSSDNGFVIRKNSARKFVLQEYCASAEAYPNINNPRASQYDTLEEAVRAYSHLVHIEGHICEYGLDVQIDEVTV